MNLDGFRHHLKTLTETELHQLGREMEDKLSRARSPQVILGYRLAIDEITIALRLLEPIPDDIAAMSLDELAAELAEFG